MAKFSYLRRGISPRVSDGVLRKHGTQEQKLENHSLHSEGGKGMSYLGNQSSCLGIKDKGNSVMLGCSQNEIFEDEEWSYEEASQRLKIRSHPHNRKYTLRAGPI